MQEFCFICLYKEFKINKFCLHLESPSIFYDVSLDQAKKDQAVGGILDRNQAESLRDFLNAILK